MSMIDSQSYIIDDALPSPTTDPDEIDSLPESAESDDIESEDDLEESDAEKEWKESLQQLELLLTMVVVPYVGKYFGRKCAYWGESVTWPSMLSWSLVGPWNLRLIAWGMSRLGEVHGMEISG